MKKSTLIFSMCMFLCSCSQRSCQETKRSFQTSERNYTVTVYSNGSKCFADSFHGGVNQEEGDGIYYFKGDTLIEVAGTYIIKSIK